MKDFMKRALLATFCATALVGSSAAWAADPVSDREMADRYFQAAQAGDSDAEFYLAALYSAGVGRQRSDEEAFRWFSRAADQGHSHAMLVLSGIYAIGRGTPKDNLNAYKWAYIVSAGSKVEEFRNGSRQLIGVLETRMTPQDISQAKADAGRWHAVSSAASPPPSPQPVAKEAPANTAGPSVDSGSPPASPSGGEKKGDMDALMDKMPSELRKRLGF
ncbi:tetratricopeptide repeat protein [Bradyrhizobium sp.]|uniref:tetratricopeptide repeat protein n=1 Tax=Bradyrhizobium sp. TaxID=376 RepID=UPI0025BDC4C4|nr:tetratricopeptide repeat protein [Bradyrhizobium sp.]